ncbi:MAG: SRPBCC family protein [Bryobacteraceae bacterium]
MRILIIVIGGFAMLIVCVVAIGSLLPQKHVASRSASFRAAPEKLFSLIAGPQSWRPDVLRDESVPDTNGRELRRETARNGETITYELLDRKPPQSITRRIATENLPYSGSWTTALQPQGETTTVRITETGQVYNPVFRFVSRFVIGHTRTIDTYLRALGKANGQEIEIGS